MTRSNNTNDNVEHTMITEEEANQTLQEYRNLHGKMTILKKQVKQLKVDEKLGNDMLQKLEEKLIAYMSLRKIRSVELNEDSDLRITNKRKLPAANVDRFTEELRTFLTGDRQMTSIDSDDIIDTVTERMQDARKQECEISTKLQICKKRGVKRRRFSV